MDESQQASPLSDGRTPYPTSILRSMRPINYVTLNNISNVGDSRRFGNNNNAGCTPLEPLFQSSNRPRIIEDRSRCYCSVNGHCPNCTGTASSYRTPQPFKPVLIPERAIPPLLLPPPLHIVEPEAGEWLLSRQLNLPPGGLARVAVEQPFMRPYRENMRLSGIFRNDENTPNIDTWIDDALFAGSWTGTDPCSDAECFCHWKGRSRFHDFERLTKLRSTDRSMIWSQVMEPRIQIDDEEPSKAPSPPSSGFLESLRRIRSLIRRSWDLRIRHPRLWLVSSTGSNRFFGHRHGGMSPHSDWTGR